MLDQTKRMLVPLGFFFVGVAVGWGAFVFTQPSVQQPFMGVAASRAVAATTAPQISADAPAALPQLASSEVMCQSASTDETLQNAKMRQTLMSKLSSEDRSDQITGLSCMGLLGETAEVLKAAKSESTGSMLRVGAIHIMGAKWADHLTDLIQLGASEDILIRQATADVVMELPEASRVAFHKTIMPQLRNETDAKLVVTHLQAMNNPKEYAALVDYLNTQSFSRSITTSEEWNTLICQLNQNGEEGSASIHPSALRQIRYPCKTAADTKVSQAHAAP